MNSKLLERFDIRINPAQALVIGFAVVILVGSILLSLPVATVSGEPTPYVDSLFTATSAVCVTGLVVVDTGTYWSLFGEVVIAILIQIGGLGFMTFGVLFALLLGRKIGLKSRLLLQTQFNEFTLQGVVRLATRILMITIGIELLATAILAIRLVPRYGWGTGVWVSFFHALSAFNNAGFDLFGRLETPFSSLTTFYGDPLVMGVIALLFIVGGIGFTVLIDLVRKHSFRKFTLHTKLVLVTTGLLIFTGTVGIALMEWSNPATLGAMNVGQALGNAFFQAVTPRTAGFNSLNIGMMTMGSQFLIIMLMFVGASPGSTGGGIKTTNLAALFAGAKAIVKGSKGAVLFNRKLPEDQINRATLVLMIAVTLVVTSTFVLTLTETADFLVIFFEVVSAFGTVGLSMGLTTELSTAGRLIISLTMFVGRLGPATVAFALARRKHCNIIGFPEEKIILG